jgi:hypothetical protein
MKKFFFLLLYPTIFYNAQGQKCKEKDVPAAVVQGFHKSYPTAKKCYWGKDSIYYQVAFYNGKAPVSVTYDDTGSPILTERQIPIEDLPTNIVAYVQKNYPGEIFKNVVQVTKSPGNVTYEVEVRDVALEFDGQGNYLEALKCHR